MEAHEHLLHSSEWTSYSYVLSHSSWRGTGSIPVVGTFFFLAELVCSHSVQGSDVLGPLRWNVMND